MARLDRVTINCRDEILETYRKKVRLEGQERRVGRRYSVSIPCQFTVQDGKHEGRIKNLAIDGAFVEAEDCPVPGTQGDLEFRDSEGHELRVTARVVHKSALSGRPDEAEGFGLYFIGFEGESLLTLKGLLNTLAATQGSKG